VALVTDAGTPAISDPGSALVARARAAGHAVVPIPGPSAVATALSAAGLPADRYLFLGFVPRRGKDRAALLGELSRSPWTIVLFEAANRLADLLDDLAETLPDRAAVVCRELTKLHEECRPGTVAALADHYRATPPLGEITLVVAGAGSLPQPAVADASEVLATIRAALDRGESRREVVRTVTARYDIPRNEAYRMVMEA
jgi:16S rRNA (cytidine1402-2'-O)-methyltransferase